MDRIENNNQRLHLVCLCLSVVACGICSVRAAPVIDHDYDLFDHLSTTFPIEDWIMRARAHSDELERCVVGENPRFAVPRVIPIDITPGEVWDDRNGCGIRRLARDRRGHSVTVSPYATAGRDAMPRPALPHHLGFRTIASLDLGPEPIIEPAN